MLYSEDALKEAASKDRTFQQFFLNVKAKLRGLSVLDPQRWNEDEKTLAAELLHVKSVVREALCDDFNTPVCMCSVCRGAN